MLITTISNRYDGNRQYPVFKNPTSDEVAQAMFCNKTHEWSYMNLVSFRYIKMANGDIYITNHSLLHHEWIIKLDINFDDIVGKGCADDLKKIK